MTSNNISWKIPTISGSEKIIPTFPELKEYVGKPYNDYVVAWKEYEKTMSELKLPINETNMKLTPTKFSILKTLIIAASIIISSCIIAYSYYESNRYVFHSYGFIIDKYNGSAIKINLAQ